MGWMTISVLLFCLQESVRWLKTLYYNSIRCRHHEKAAKDEFYGINKTSKRVLLDNYWCSDTATGLFPHPIDAIISCQGYCLRRPFSSSQLLIQYLLYIAVLPEIKLKTYNYLIYRHLHSTSGIHIEGAKIRHKQQERQGFCWESIRIVSSESVSLISIY